VSRNRFFFHSLILNKPPKSFIIFIYVFICLHQVKTSIVLKGRSYSRISRTKHRKDHADTNTGTHRIGAPSRSGGRGDYEQPDRRHLKQPESRRHYHSHYVDSEDQSVSDKDEDELKLQQHLDSDITFLE